jgi:hypothetical protein
MAAGMVVPTQPSGNQCLFDSVIVDTSCPNCFVLNEQLEIVTQELKTARTIITFLKEEAISTCEFPTLDSWQHHQISANILSATDTTWTTVTGKANKKKVWTPNNIRKIEPQITSTNSFSPPDNLKIHQMKYKPHPMNSSDKSPTNSPRKNLLRINEIPTIINGRVKYSANQNSSKIITKLSKVKLTKNNKYAHKVHIIGDSHFKGIATKLKQYLGTNYVVSSFIKPGANVMQIVETQEIELKCLGRNYFIVINGGSNDLANNPSEDNGVLSCLLNFVQKFPNTNVLILNVPIRYDPLTNYQVNQHIMNFNDKLQKSTRLCNHVHLIETSTDRKYFTNHGFHLNKSGKERIVKQIVCQIREIINSMSKNEHTDPPHLKDDHTSGTMKIDVVQPSSSTSCEGRALQLGTMRAIDERVIVNSGLDKVEEGKIELMNVNELEPRTLKAKKTGDESTLAEGNIDETRDLCIVNNETKNVNVNKCVKVSKSMYDLQSVTVTEEGPGTTREIVTGF